MATLGGGLVDLCFLVLSEGGFLVLAAEVVWWPEELT